MPNPKVSVCIATYNRAQYLRATISSALEQRFRDFEVVVSDDGSSDQTAEVVRSFSDGRIRYLRNPRNLGLWGNTNQCLAEARGDYVIFLQDDDAMLPGLLAGEVAVLDNQPEVVLVHAACQQVDAAGRVINVPPQSWPRVAAGLDFVRLLWSGAEYAVVMSSAMFRRSTAPELGGFNPELLFCADAEMWQRMALQGKVAFLPQVLVSSRVHSGQVTSQILFDQSKMLEERLKHAESTRTMVARQGGNLDGVINRRLSRYIASDLTSLRWHGVPVRKVLAYALEGIRRHPDTLRRFSFYRNLMVALFPPALVRWLRGTRGRWRAQRSRAEGISNRRRVEPSSWP